jgi:RNA polymerase sigma-70 factor, ECF subfamily
MFCACHNYNDAEDLTQDCFMRAMRSWGAFQGTGSRQAWLFAIARSTQIDWFRKERRQKRVCEERTDGDRQAVMTNPSRDEGEAIWQAVEQLGPDHRDVVHLKFAGGLSYAEIAELLRIPIGTVRSRLFRGLQALRGLVEE